MTIKLELDLEQVNDLCSICDEMPFNIDVCAGRLIVDGCSVMGVMGLCGKTVEIKPITHDIIQIVDFLNHIKPLGAYIDYD